MTARRRLLLVVVVVVVAMVAVGAYVAMGGRGNTDPVTRAMSVLRSETRFDSSTEAVTSFALVYQHLADATKLFPKDCAVATGKGRCLGLNQAASWTLGFSPLSGHCTQPAIQTGRLAILDYVERTSALAAATAEPPGLPPIPTC